MKIIEKLAKNKKTKKKTDHMKCNKIHKLYNVEILISF